MARNGERKGRNHRANIRNPELGYYFIVTDGKVTEQNYLLGFKASIPVNIQDEKIVIKVCYANTKDLVKKCMELVSLEAQIRIPWVVFDRDRVVNFDEMIQEAKSAEIGVGWSNPCIEIWFQTYFGGMPVSEDSITCLRKFETRYKKEVNQVYLKNDRDIYRKLFQFGDEEKAISKCKQQLKKMERECKTIPSEMIPCTTIHTLIEEIRNKVFDTP